ncbi:hypothetical protein [uncultured Sphingomonas sp.]|uniref:hypothetical protein n=1 Tax=uncultured Sphingomonas sp. TaxID=158754 RepID=UPI0035CABA8B
MSAPGVAIEATAGASNPALRSPLCVGDRSAATASVGEAVMSEEGALLAGTVNPTTVVGGVGAATIEASCGSGGDAAMVAAPGEVGAEAEAEAGAGAGAGASSVVATATGASAVTSSDVATVAGVGSALMAGAGWCGSGPADGIVVGAVAAPAV